MDKNARVQISTPALAWQQVMGTQFTHYRGSTADWRVRPGSRGCNWNIWKNCSYFEIFTGFSTISLKEAISSRRSMIRW